MADNSRRDFLKTTAAGVAASGIAASVLAQQQDSPDGVPKRPLGKTGEKVSIIGLGGWHLGAIDESLAIRIMHEAIDGGVTFFDNAWDYHDGGSEEVMGKGLASDGRRDKVFLMTKNCNRDYEGSKKCLEDSLRRLKTDHLDLWQFHEINYDNDPDWVFEKGGLKAALEARQTGKVRFIGFTGHKHPEIHLKMIHKPFDWDTAQMPINVMDANYRSFQREVVPECERRGIGVIGMKSLGGGSPRGNIPKMAKLDAVRCRHYSLSLPVSVLVCGTVSLDDLHQDLKLARGFRPMSADEMQQFRHTTSAEAGDGRYELFKSTQTFDSPYHQHQHGFATENA
jgi:predicted aldo/keto reductase-like oxidoreductase